MNKISILKDSQYIDSTPDLDFLRNEVNKLKGLLDDPQIGVSEWCIAYRETVQNITGFWSTNNNRYIEAINKLIAIAKQMNQWAKESRKDGWSTYQVEPMQEKAAEIYQFIDGL